MATAERHTGVRTHTVENQAPALVDYNVFESDTVMKEAVKREGADWAVERITEVGEIAGRGDVIELGRLANENPRSSAPTTATATGSTSRSSTRPGMS